MKRFFNMKVAILIAITIAFMEIGVIIYNNSMDQYIHKIVFDLGFILILANILFKITKLAYFVGIFGIIESGIIYIAPVFFNVG